MPHARDYHHPSARSIGILLRPIHRRPARWGAQADRTGDPRGAGCAHERLFWGKASGRAGAPGAPRPPPGTRGDDRYRSSAGEGASRAGPWRRRRQDQLHASILPRYLRKAESIEELLPWLYLKGVSTGDFSEALEALLGPNAKGLSAKTITRLKADWWKDYEAWQKRDLCTRRFLYIWADGVYFKPRMAEEKQCVLVIVGADEYGRKELLAMTDGFRESTQSWRELLLDLKRRGLTQEPKLAIGDGALGFWTALREVFATTKEQRCWVHKTMNVLNAMPKSIQAKANVAFDFFIETYGVKWDKAVAKLIKDRDALLTFYDYPAEHWKHIRTSNPIESTFATVRHRTKRTKGCLSRKTGLAMAFKLMMSALRKAGANSTALPTSPTSSRASISSTASSHQTRIKPPHDDRLDTRFDSSSKIRPTGVCRVKIVGCIA